MLISIRATVTAALFSTSLGIALPVQAQDTKPAVAGTSIPVEELTPAEKAEREARKDCKIEICSAFHNRKPGPDIACDVLKSWRKEQLDKMVAKAKVSWPWGAVQCTAKIKLTREQLIKGMTEPKYEAALDKHEVACVVDRANEAKADI